MSMINFFDFLYASISEKKSLLKKMRYYSLLRYIIRTVANVVLPLYFTMSFNNRKYTITNIAPSSQSLILSLTSFPARINKLWIVIESLFRQTRKPDKIILWLSKQQFSSINILPNKLLLQQRRGLEIRLVDEDLRSHKKYYYLMKESPESILITVDDDIIYNTRLIETLLVWHDKFPLSIIARYAYKIEWSGSEIKSYKEWTANFAQNFPQSNIFFGSGGGTLFPPNIMPKETINKELFLKLCPFADDVWLNAMCQLNQVKIFRPTVRQCSLLPVIINNNITLSEDNLSNNQNDIQIQKTIDYYKQKYKIRLFSESESGSGTERMLNRKTFC